MFSIDETNSNMSDKEVRQQFFIGHTGTTVSEILAISIIGPIALFLRNTVCNIYLRNCGHHR